MKLTKINKSGRWWKGTRTTWVTKDKEGDWQLMRRKSSKKSIKKDAQCRWKCNKHLSWKEYALIVLSIMLGVSLAYNLYHML